jgi:hypothetical protein
MEFAASSSPVSAASESATPMSLANGNGHVHLVQGDPIIFRNRDDEPDHTITTLFEYEADRADSDPPACVRIIGHYQQPDELLCLTTSLESPYNRGD